MASRSKKRMVTAAAGGLPDDCWEYVLSKLFKENDSVNKRNRYLETVSLVSKQLLAITNRYVYSFTLRYNPPSSSSSLLSRLFYRFSNLTSLDLSHFRGDLNFIDSFAALKGLTCLDLSFSCVNDSLLSSLALEPLPLTKLVLQGCFNYTYTGISYLLSKCRSLRHLDLQRAKFLNDQLFIELCAFLGDLVYINVSGCDKLTSSAFFALLRSCPLLTEIRMESTKIGIGPIPSSEDLVVYHQVKSLHLAYNSRLQDKHIDMFALMFPNMQFLDLSSCHYISEEGITTLLKRCLKLRRLNFAAFFPQAKLFSINSNLEVLNLSHSRIDDEVLYEISKICPRLLQLDLEHCYDVTEKGVRLAVENCTHLREINLQHCHKVSTDIVFWMIFSRPSLRKITALPHFRTRDCDRKLLERCLVC